MALNINGTTGISGVDGSASAPAVTGTDSNTGINFASDTVNINTGGQTRATINSSGKLIVGSTDDYAENVQAAFFGASNGGIALASGTSGLSRLMFADATSGNAGASVGSIIYAHSDNSLRFNINGGSERMRIDSNGLLGIGTTGASKVLEVSNTGKTNYSTCFMHADGSDNVRVMGLRSDRASGGTFGQMIEFFNSSGSNVGQIASNGSSTSYNTSSDYRLKENATAISDGITRLKILKPYRFNWKVDPTTTVDGFFAHEVTAVPEAVKGTKDQVATADDVNDEIKEGDPIYQSIDQSKLVPLLTAALQEAIAKIEVLETKVAALEAG